MQTLVAQFATSLHSFSSVRPCTVDLLRGSCQRHNRPPAHFAATIEGLPADHQVSWQVFSSVAERNENVIVRPVGNIFQQTQITMVLDVGTTEEAPGGLYHAFPVRARRMMISVS